VALPLADSPRISVSLCSGTNSDSQRKFTPASFGRARHATPLEDLDAAVGTGGLREPPVGREE
jgi:hypothetical protein